MARNPRVQEMLADLTPDERAELAEVLARPRDLLPADAFLDLLQRLPKDSGLADDIEAGVRASRATPEASSSPWDR
jgi:hypothetical protein